MIHDSPSRPHRSTDAAISRSCLYCNYDLTGLADGARCPECGRVSTPDEIEAAAARPPRFRWWVAPGFLVPGALAVLLGLNGLRVSEACATNIEDLGFERGHRTLQIMGKGTKPATTPLVPRTARTIDLANGERVEGPILRRQDGQRLDRRTAHRWVASIARRAGLGPTHPHMLRAAFIMAALDAGVPLREVQSAARHADPRTTTVYDRRRQNLDRHAAYVVVAFVAGG